MVICGSDMFEFGVSKDLKKIGYNKGGAAGKIVTYLCLTLIVKGLKISVEQGGNNTKYNQTLNILFNVLFSLFSMTRLGNTKKIVLSRCHLLINIIFYLSIYLSTHTQFYYVGFEVVLKYI